MGKDNFLYDDEVVIWSGKPNVEKAMNKKLYFLFEFGVIFGIIVGIGLFLKFGRISLEDGYVLPGLLPLIFGISPLFFLILYRRYDVKKLKNTEYYLTNYNIIVINELKVRKKSIASVKKSEVKLKEKSDGFGDIIFEEDLYSSYTTKDTSNFTKIRDGFYFLGIDGVRQVYDLFLDKKA